MTREEERKEIIESVEQLAYAFNNLIFSPWIYRVAIVAMDDKGKKVSHSLLRGKKTHKDWHFTLLKASQLLKDKEGLENGNRDGIVADSLGGIDEVDGGQG